MLISRVGACFDRFQSLSTRATSQGSHWWKSALMKICRLFMTILESHQNIKSKWSKVSNSFCCVTAASQSKIEESPSSTRQTILTYPDYSQVSQLIMHLKWPQRMNLTRLNLLTSQIRIILTYRNWLAFELTATDVVCKTRHLIPMLSRCACANPDHSHVALR